jgi:SAM-dependent methyltransferase
MSYMRKDVRLHRSILKEFGYKLDSDSLILDFGCGAGELVQEYRDAGLRAFGVDIVLQKQGPFLRLIPEDYYRIPFDDNTFDFIFSNSVFEHVRDLSLALAEIKRVLKPGGVSLHLFPPKARLIEAHLFVPFGGIFQNHPWLLLWASLGIRNSFQKGLDFKETAARNYVWPHNNIFNRTKRELKELITVEFQNLAFADSQMIKHSYGQAVYLFPLKWVSG